MHLLLGNHEVMNLVGDLRYVAPGEYAAFAAEEDPTERAAWRERFIARAASGATPEELAAQFERAHPPGFFAHRRAFRADGKYGRWLLEKPLVLVVNDSAFAHGGLSPLIAELGVDTVNARMGAELRAYTEAVATLTDAGALLPGDSFYAHRQLIDQLPPSPTRPPEMLAALEVLRNPPEPSVHDMNSPTWYRGNVGCPALVERGRLQPVLDALGVRRVVIGHTPTVTRDVVSRVDGRVIEIDTGMLSDYYGGTPHALVLEGDAVSVIDGQGNSETIDPDTRPTGGGALPVVRQQAVLADGDVVLGEAAGEGVYQARVALGDDALAALFIENRSRRSAPDVAAYRLDRLLDLGLVPLTVEREIDGRRGALQLMPPNVINEAQRIEAQAGGSAWCPLTEQWQAMYVFDVLIHKEARTAPQILYDQESWRLMLSGHGNAFSTRRGRPRYLKNAPIVIDAAWREALTALDEASLEAALGDSLERRQLRAILKRRDELLAGG